MLPIPKNDPLITLPETSEKDFFDLEAPEDEKLLATGKWEGEDVGEE